MSLRGAKRVEATEKRSGAGERSSEQAEQCKRSDSSGRVSGEAGGIHFELSSQLKQ